jgi:hypothetical protein
VKELSLHYIWQHQLFFSTNLKTTSGEKISIKDKGEFNQNSGPDYFNGKIYIEGILFAGNIEIHLLTSDWNKHRHDSDPSYDNVILHVVFEHDKEIKNSKGIIIPTLELKFILFSDLSVLKKPINISVLKQPICKNNSVIIDGSIQKEWLNKLYQKRVSDKVKEVENIYENSNQILEETIYQIGAKSFGFNTNSVPFEILVKNLPINLIKKFLNDDIKLEAVLFGVAGFLNQDDLDDYHCLLKREFNKLKDLYQLNTLNNSVWKFSRMHPQNFPTIRIAQFVQFIKIIHLVSEALNDENSYSFWKEMLQLKLTAYWESHYYFSRKTKSGKNLFGNNSINLIIINSIVPLILFNSKLKSSKNLYSNALEIMKLTMPEKNTITKKFIDIICKPQNGIDSQALNYLYKDLCLKSACNNCLIGKKILNLS